MTDKVQSTQAEPVKEARRGSCLRIGGALFGIMVSALFLANLSGGFIEIPDNLPLVGNLDEVAATVLLIYCFSLLGVNFPGRR